MSLKSTDYLIDLLQELNDPFVGINAVHPDGTRTHLDDLGFAAFEMMAQIIDTAGRATLHMRSPLPDAHTVTIRLRSIEDTDLWDVYFEAGTKTDELNISHIIGELKEIYS